MGDLPAQLLKWSLRLLLVVAAIFAFVVVLNLASQLLFVSLNANVLSDVFALIQIWLPFDLDVILLWVTTASIAYITYRLTLASIIWLNRIIGEN